WKTDLGVGIGSSLKNVESINGKPFLVSGFGWDYAGTTFDWKRGSITEKLVVTFEEPNRPHSSLIGDQGILSDDTRLSRLNPKVRTMRILF
ncbi:MAG: hypothetical protein OEQ53_17460, partial [Saprospiraceae bacterium]|nr:hypothetical protein [Saprospiraceae bacterium]